MQNSARTVLITGGTSGLGKAMGLAFAANGDKVFLTYAWGSADMNALVAEYQSAGYLEPTLICADVSDSNSTLEIMQEIKKNYQSVDIFISNVSFADPVKSINEMSRPSFQLTLNYSAWPLVEYLQKIKAAFGHYPKYTIAISSDAAVSCHPGYAFSGCSKAVMETLVRYLTVLLKDEGVHINAIRPGMMETPSVRASLGNETVDRIKVQHPDFIMSTQSVANVVVALCSGLMDAVNGETITVDNGLSHISPVNYILRD